MMLVTAVIKPFKLDAVREALEAGDVGIHDEEAYPVDDGFTRVGEMASVGAGPSLKGAFAEAGLGSGGGNPAVVIADPTGGAMSREAGDLR